MIQTERLTLRPIDTADAGFLLALLNDESFIRFIGDRGVHDLTQSTDYIRDLLEKQHGSLETLLVVTGREDPQPMGVCSLRKRDELDDPDIGFAFLPEFRGQGFAIEATRAMLAHTRQIPEIQRVVAIVSPDNARSISLLEKLGFRRDREVQIEACPGTSIQFVPREF